MAKEQPSPQTVTKKHLARKQKEERQVKTALTITGIIIAIVLFLLAYVLIDNYIVKPNTVVARVGETEIKAKQFQSNTKYSRLNMINQANQYVSYFGEYGIEAARNMVLQLSDPTVVGETVLNQLIDEVIIREEAEKRGISVTDEEVEALMREQFNFYPDGTLTPTVTTTPVYTPTWSSAQIVLIDPTATFTPFPEPTSTPEGWEPTASEPESEATTDVEVAPSEETSVEEETTPTPVPSITPTPTPYTTRLFSKDVQSYYDYVGTYGITKSDIENILRMGLLRDKLVADITKDLEPFEEQVWVRHILVEDQETAEEVIGRLDAGESWNSLAVEYSTDESNKNNGGDLGWIGPNDSYDPDFLDGAFALDELGQISEPVQSQFGWHIIQLVTKANNPIDSYAFDQLKQTHFNDWLAEIRASRSDIETESVWTEFAPDQPAVPQELSQYLFSN